MNISEGVERGSGAGGGGRAEEAKGSIFPVQFVNAERLLFSCLLVSLRKLCLAFMWGVERRRPLGGLCFVFGVLFIFFGAGAGISQAREVEICCTVWVKGYEAGDNVVGGNMFRLFGSLGRRGWVYEM